MNQDKNKKNLLLDILAFTSIISPLNGTTFNDLIYLSNDTVMNMNVHLLLEICELLEKGYTYDMILQAIIELEFDNNIFTKDEQDFLRRDAIKTLKIKYNQKENE